MRAEVEKVSKLHKDQQSLARLEEEMKELVAQDEKIREQNQAFLELHMNRQE